MFNNRETAVQNGWKLKEAMCLLYNEEETLSIDENHLLNM